MVSLRTRVFQTWFRLQRPMTLGVRGVVENHSGQVLLVHHTYPQGWFLPGGGVEHAEPVATALKRELAEEGGIALTGPSRLVGIYSNHDVFRNDHVVLYHVPFASWQACPTDHQGEISDLRWCDPDALPDAATPGTRRRLAQLFSGGPDSPFW
jgi:8-oxo-dGTP pyrophosphatase MutT (NUDIX family)